MQRLDTAYGSFTAYVNRLVTIEGIIFHISFVDNHKTHIILIKKTFEGFEFMYPEKLPDWIIDLQSKLETIIKKEHLIELSSIAVAV